MIAFLDLVNFREWLEVRVKGAICGTFAILYFILFDSIDFTIIESVCYLLLIIFWGDWLFVNDNASLKEFNELPGYLFDHLCVFSVESHLLLQHSVVLNKISNTSIYCFILLRL